MLIAILLGIFLSTGSSTGSMIGQNFIDDLSAKVENNIIVSDQKKELLSLVDDMEDEIKKFSNQLKGSSKAIKRLNKDYDATREDFETILHELNTNRAGTQEKIMKIRFKMKNRLTREEWKKVFSGS